MPTQTAFEPAPTRQDVALSPEWLTFAISQAYPGIEVTAVNIVETQRTMAVKIRFTVEYAKPAPGVPTAFCIKGFFDVAPDIARAAFTEIREGDFYTKIAPGLSMRLPRLVYAGADRTAQVGLILMEDLIVQGARFLSALDTVEVDTAALTLGQLAKLHASHPTPEALAKVSWVPEQLATMDPTGYVTAEQLQTMLDGPRGEGLTARVRSAETLARGFRALAAENLNWRQVLVHGDSHAGNIFMTRDGPGLIDWQVLQRGGWALDVGYHICALLPVEVAAANEQRLLAHYLELLAAEGVEPPSFDEALRQYRWAVIYGYYMWAITRRVDPAVINVFVNRLGSAVERSGSYDLAGV